MQIVELWLLPLSHIGGYIMFLGSLSANVSISLCHEKFLCVPKNLIEELSPNIG